MIHILDTTDSPANQFLSTDPAGNVAQYSTDALDRNRLRPARNAAPATSSTQVDCSGVMLRVEKSTPAPLKLVGPNTPKPGPASVSVTLRLPDRLSENVALGRSMLKISRFTRIPIRNTSLPDP